ALLFTDRDLPRLDLRLLRNDHLQHAVLQLRLDVLTVGTIRQRERAAEAPVRAFAGVVGVALFVLLLFALARNREVISGQRDLQVLLAYARQVGAEHVAFLVLLHVEARREETIFAADAGHGFELAERVKAENVAHHAERIPDGRAGGRDLSLISPDETCHCR